MKHKIVVKKLNSYLEGIYMGIHAFEHYMYHTKDEPIKRELQRMQQEHKEAASLIAERIQDLGGKAATDTGFKLSMMEGILNMKGYPKTTEEILKGLIKGQTKGIGKTEEILKGDLDETSLALVQNNLARDRKQIQQLNRLLTEHESN